MAIKQIAILALASMAAAAPNGQPQSFCKQFTDTFEEYGTIVAAPELSPVGTYHGVTYQAFDVSTKSLATGATSGNIPQSGQNDATAAVNGDIVQFQTITLNAFGNIIASPSKSFDLYSFYFGCGVAAGSNQAPSTAVGCNLAVTGYDKTGRQIPVASFNYAPTNSVASKMVLAELPFTFRNLQNVTLGVASSSGVTAATLLHIDDVVHCNYS